MVRGWWLGEWIEEGWLGDRIGMVYSERGGMRGVVGEGNC